MRTARALYCVGRITQRSGVKSPRQGMHRSGDALMGVRRANARVLAPRPAVVAMIALRPRAWLAEQLRVVIPGRIRLSWPNSGRRQATRNEGVAESSSAMVHGQMR